jgi:hypothetical protein
MNDLVVPGALALLLIILLVLIFNQQLSYWVASTKNAVVSVLTGEQPAKPCAGVMDDDDMYGIERLNDPKITTMQSSDTVNSTLDALGYTADAPWDEVLQATELDPSTFVNHMDFVKDVRRFSSGANFTSVTDDNTNLAFTNFVGLRRPEHVPIGPDARQQPDIDETVLQRNRPLRW